MSELEDIRECVHYYHRELTRSQVAKDYLKSRGLTKDSIIKFQLGYCPHNPTKGALKYQDRIIFPIWNVQDEIVGWTGRTLVNDGRKYLNTPESDIFKKSRLLYGYNFAKKAIFKTKTAVLMEGQVDVIIAHQMGVLNAVASSGTSGLKEQNASILARFAKRVYITFDGDEAGYKGAIIAELALLEAGVEEIIIVHLPEKEDPASYLQQYGTESFLNLLYDARQIKKTT